MSSILSRFFPFLGGGAGGIFSSPVLPRFFLSIPVLTLILTFLWRNRPFTSQLFNFSLNFHFHLLIFRSYFFPPFSVFSFWGAICACEGRHVTRNSCKSLRVSWHQLSLQTFAACWWIGRSTASKDDLNLSWSLASPSR